MGACATKPGDLKVEGDAPLVVEDAAEKKVGGVDQTDPAADDVSRRRSLSDLLREDAESDGEAPAADKKNEPAATATADETGATEEQLTAQPSIATTEQDTAEEREPKGAQDPDAHAQVAEEEKCVDPDSVQVAVFAAAESVEENKVADASI